MCHCHTKGRNGGWLWNYVPQPTPIYLSLSSVVSLAMAGNYDTYETNYLAKEKALLEYGYLDRCMQIVPIEMQQDGATL